MAGCQLSQLSARDLLGLAHAAAAQGLALTSARSGPLFTRLARGITSRMELVGAGAAARVKGQQLAGDQVTAAEAASLLVLCSKAQCRDTATLGLLAARLAEHKSELPAVAAANVALAVVRLGLVAAAPAAAVQLLQRAAAAVNEEHAAGRRLPKGVAGRAAVALIQANAPGTAAKAAAGGSGAAGGSVSQEALREAAAKVVAGLKLDELSDKQKAVIAKDYAARGKTLPQALQSIALVP